MTSVTPQAFLSRPSQKPSLAIKNQLCLESLSTKCHEMESALIFRNLMKAGFPTDDRFFLSYEEKEVYPLSEKHPLPYPAVNATVHFPPLRPNFEYVLYCPFTGCPESPEVFMEFKTDDEGHPILAALFDKFKEYNIRCNPGCIILLYANPGYCSDWYLMSSSPLCTLHTSFTYKPIIVSGADGREAILNKKEAGGNILELLLKKFPPNKQVVISSLSAGNTYTDVINIKEDGTYNLGITPSVLGFTKGVDRITIFSGDDPPLEISCEWDRSTLSIKRVSPPSDMWSTVLNVGAIMSCEKSQKGLNQS